MMMEALVDDVPVVVYCNYHASVVDATTSILVYFFDCTCLNVSMILLNGSEQESELL